VAKEIIIASDPIDKISEFYNKKFPIKVTVSPR